MSRHQPAWIFQTPSCFAVKMGKNIFSHLGAEQICCRDVWISPETVLILALLHVMPARRVQCWVRARGMGKASGPGGGVRASRVQPAGGQTLGGCRGLGGCLTSKGKLGLNSRPWRDEHVSEISLVNQGISLTSPLQLSLSNSAHFWPGSRPSCPLPHLQSQLPLP